MLDSSRRRITEELAPDALVLDVGAWASPLARADWVIDLLPYETRGLYGELSVDEERFDQDTWVVRDICDHEPWPFEDDQFDFVVCSHTLEDIRDPIWVCAELRRIGRAGYIEVPSRLEEQTPGLEGAWTGWSHHRWLVDVDESDARISFVHKPGLLHTRPRAQFPPWVAGVLTAEERVQTMFWSGGFDATEIHFTEPEGFDAHVEDFVRTQLPTLEPRAPRPAAGRGGRGLRRRFGIQRPLRARAASRR